jgi:hypothetical protein
MEKIHLVALRCTINLQLVNSVKPCSPDKKLKSYKVSVEQLASFSDKSSINLLAPKNSESIPGLKSYLSSSHKGSIKSQSVVNPIISNDKGISKDKFYMLKDSLNGYLDSCDFIWKCSGRNIPINCSRLPLTKSTDIIIDSFSRPHFSFNRYFFGMTSELCREFKTDRPSLSRPETNPASYKLDSMERLLTRFVTNLDSGDKAVTISPEILLFSKKNGSLDKQIMSRKGVISLRALNRFIKVQRRYSFGYLS